eukprot:scaffold33587_cov52-Attheya_sp.AAC.1
MIPAKLYVSGNTGDEVYNPKYRKGQHKESKEARRARNKEAKLAKFDPKKAETTRQAKERKAQEDAAELYASGSDDEDDDDEDMPNQGEDEDEENATPVKALPPSVAPSENSSRIEELRARLRAKIAEKQSQRPNTETGAAAVSKRAARRAEKERRVQEAKQKNHTKVITKHTTMKLKDNSQHLIDQLQNASKETDLQGIDFGGIAGLTKKAHYLDNKSLSNANKKKSLERLLEEAETKKKRLQELKASGDAVDKAKAQKMEWGDTLKEASGQKIVKPEQLKKALKHKIKKKAKSAKAWNSRLEQTKDALDERQKIRNHNLDKRKLGGAIGANLSKKRIEAADGEGDSKAPASKRSRMGPHSGNSRPGFEGKKQDFINKKSKTGDTSTKKKAQ